jgi:hypothetical protein
VNSSSRNDQRDESIVLRALSRLMQNQLLLAEPAHECERHAVNNKTTTEISSPQLCRHESRVSRSTTESTATAATTNARHSGATGAAMFFNGTTKEMHLGLAGGEAVRALARRAPSAQAV